MARVLVTGGAGFIGSHVADACIAAGHAVAVVDDLSTGRAANLNPRAAFFRADIRDAKLEECFAEFRPEFVQHLAAQIDVRRSVQEPVFDAEVNVLGTLRILEACLKHGVRKLVFASTGGAIYGQPQELPADENCPPAPMSPYGTSKLAAEHFIRLYGRLHGLPYTILRFPNVYGPRQIPEGEAGVCSIFTGLMLAGKQPVLYGEGAPLRDYVYVGDIARGALLALDRAPGETVNLGSGRGTSVREIFDHLKRLTGYAGDPQLAPLRPGEVERIYTTGDRAKALLGWTPEVGLEEGLARVVAHVRATAA